MFFVVLKSESLAKKKNDFFLKKPTSSYDDISNYVAVVHCPHRTFFSCRLYVGISTNTFLAYLHEEMVVDFHSLFKMHILCLVETMG